jgi:uncharacterized protein
LKRKIARPAKAKKPTSISDMLVARSRRPRIASVTPEQLFRLPSHPPGVAPKGSEMAMDEFSAFAWGIGDLTGHGIGMFPSHDGVGFIGYARLAELAQRPEYRVISETIATEMVREGIKFQATGEDDKTDQIKRIEDEVERLDVRDAFMRACEQDGFFGRAHIYLDTGDTDNRDELKTDIGDGRSNASKAKITKDKPIRALRNVEAVWTYPTGYNSNDPLSPDWYRPKGWYVMGKEIHKSRLLTFVGREVPDILKPAYSFGGLSVSQMAMRYVDNWLRTTQSVSDIVNAFSVMVLHTDLATLLTGAGDELFKRADLFTNFRDNKGLMILNKDAEDLKNVSAPLGGLDVLQAQTQEHMAAVSRIPTVKLLGLQPAGLNADSEGVMRAFYDSVHAYQERFFRPNLQTIVDFIQLSLFGAVDPEITFAFNPLWSLDEKAEADKRKTESDTHAAYVNLGAVSPDEVRRALASDDDSPYAALDLDEPLTPEIDIGGGYDPSADPSLEDGPTDARGERLDRSRDDSATRRPDERRPSTDVPRRPGDDRRLDAA